MMELADIQSISAAIQTMCLEATAHDIGSLWNCNVFIAYDELKEWLGEEGEMVAAIASATPTRKSSRCPESRSRKSSNTAAITPKNGRPC